MGRFKTLLTDKCLFFNLPSHAANVGSWPNSGQDEGLSVAQAGVGGALRVFGVDTRKPICATRVSWGCGTTGSRSMCGERTREEFVKSKKRKANQRMMLVQRAKALTSILQLEGSDGRGRALHFPSLT